MRRCVSLNPAERPAFSDILETLYELAEGLLSRPPVGGPPSASPSPFTSREQGANPRMTGAGEARSPPTSAPQLPTPFAAPAAAEPPQPVSAFALAP